MNISQLNQNNNNDLKSRISKVWKNIPLFIRFITFTTLILYILNLFIPKVSFYLSNIPYFTIYKINIWRISTTILITTDILNIILSLFFWIKYASELESSMGTIKYFLIFTMNSIIIQIFYTLISYLISLLINNKQFLLAKIKDKNDISNSGVWPYIICELSLLSLSNPNQPMKILFFPCQFKAKFYPIILFIIFSIMNSFIIDLEILTGIIYAFIYHIFIKKKIKISDELIEKIENLSIFKCCTKMGGFVRVNNLGNKLVSTVNSVNRHIKDSIKQSNKVFTPFQGGGVIVGGNYGEPKSDDYRGASQTTSLGIEKSKNETLDVKINS